MPVIFNDRIMFIAQTGDNRIAQFAAGSCNSGIRLLPVIPCFGLNPHNSVNVGKISTKETFRSQLTPFWLPDGNPGVPSGTLIISIELMTFSHMANFQYVIIKETGELLFSQNITPYFFLFYLKKSKIFNRCPIKVINIMII